MKKLLGAALALTLGVTCVGALAACDNGNDDTPDTPVVSDAQLTKDAMSAIKAMYINKYVNTSTPNDYTLVGQYPINGTYCPITWTVNVTEGITVTAMDATTKTVTIDVNEKTTVDIEYELTATITYNGVTETYTFTNLKVPKYDVNSHADYTSATKGDKLRIVGTVIGFAKKDDGATTNTIFLQDADGGYYVYSLTEKTLPDGLAIGKEITVSGEYDLYNGLHELKSATIEKIENGTAVEPKDITDLIKAAKDNKDETIVAMQSQLVTIKGVTLYDVSATNNTYYGFKLGKVETYLRISTSDCPTNAANQTKIIADHAANLGKNATVTGIITVYGGAFYIVPVSGDAFKDFTENTTPPADKVAEEKEAVKLVEKITEDGDVALPKPATYQDVAFTWESSNTEVIAIAEDNSKMTVKVPAEATEVTVTLTLKCGDVTETKVFKITVEAVSIKPGVYKLGFYQAQNKQKLYFTGVMNSSEFGETTSDASAAADVVVAEATGGYTLKVGAKFIEVYKNEGGKYRMTLVDEATGVWKYDGSLGVFTYTLDSKIFYLGAYGSNTTFGASETSYISGGNAGNVGVSQYIGITEKYVATGTFKLAMYQAKQEKKLYFKGTLNSGEYGETTEDIAEAANVVVAAKENGYTLKVGEKYLEVYKNEGGKYRMTLVDASTGVWVYDQEVNTFTWTLDEKVFYLGTYDNNTTFGASETKYIMGENAEKVGVSQYVAGMEKFAEEGTFKLAMRHPKLSKTLYFAGTINDKEYGETTENIAEAAEVVVAKVEGGYTLKVGAKFLEVYKNSGGKYRMTLVDESTVAWVFDQDLQTFTFTLDSKIFYLGTYDNNTTFGASETKYIMGENASKIGDSQYVAYLEGSVADNKEPEAPYEPTASVIIKDYATANGWENSTKHLSVNIDEHVTATAAPETATNTGNYFTTGNQWRFYQNENPTLTIAAGEGYKIVSVKITYDSNNDGVLVSEDKATQYASGTVIEVNAASVVLSVGNTGTKTNGQARITKIEIIYEAV